MEEEKILGSDDSETELTIEDGEDVHRCTKCVYFTKRKYDLKRHLERVHKEHQQSIPTSTSDDTYLCHACPLLFKSKAGLFLHIKDKHTLIYKYTCSTCDRGFNRLWDFKGHVNKHNQLKSEKCTKCDKVFFYKSKLLKYHLREKHSNKKDTPKYLCSICGAGYGGKNALREHTKRVHENRHFRCSCGKSFRWRSGYRYHLNVCKDKLESMD